MRILIISTSVIPVGAGFYGGIEKNVYDMAEALFRAGHKVAVLAPYGSKLSNGIRHIPSVKLPDEQDRDDIAINQGLYGRGGGLGIPDVILDYSHGHFIGRADPTNPDWVNQVKRLPMVNFVWDPIQVRYTKACFNIACLSKWQRDRFSALYNQKAMVFPKWGYVNGLWYKPAKSPRRERFLFLGKLTAEKGGLQAVELARRAGVGLDVVGGLLATDNRAYADGLRDMADKDVRFHGNVSEERKIEFIQNAKAVVYPVQFDEAHNMVAVESAACQTPFIQYRRGAIGAEPELASELGVRVVDSPSDFEQAMRTVDDWYVPTKEDWTIQGRLPVYLKFFNDIHEGLRW